MITLDLDKEGDVDKDVDDVFKDGNDYQKRDKDGDRWERWW